MSDVLPIVTGCLEAIKDVQTSIVLVDYPLERPLWPTSEHNVDV